MKVYREVDGLGDRIQRARKEYTKSTGKTLKSVYTDLGLSRSYWNQIEKEEIKSIAWHLVKQIENLFDVSLLDKLL